MLPLHWLLKNQIMGSESQWVCNTCPENMQKAANRFGGACLLLGAEKGYFWRLAAEGVGRKRWLQKEWDEKGGCRRSGKKENPERKEEGGYPEGELGRRRKKMRRREETLEKL